mgnify:CR=1 FL=1
MFQNIENDSSNKRMLKIWYTLFMKRIHSVVWKEDKWFVAKALEVEVTSQGKNEEEALKNLKEALELYFEDQSQVELSPVNKPKLQDLSIQVNA